MIQHIDRAPTYPGRVTLTPVAGQADTYDMVRADEPTQEGNAINKALQDEFLAASGTTTGTGSAFLLAQAGFYLQDGAAVRLKLHTMPLGVPTLNVESSGAHPVVTPKGKPLPGYPAGTWVTVIYNEDSGNFILQGDGGSAGARYGNEVGQISSFELMLCGNNSPTYERSLFSKKE